MEIANKKTKKTLELHVNEMHFINLLAWLKAVLIMFYEYGSILRV